MTSISELTFFGSPILFLDEMRSTSDYLKNSHFDKPRLIITDNQTYGRGQYGKAWDSQCAKNLCFSFQYFPKNLRIEMGYRISQSIALGLVEIINGFIFPDVSYIKWPNDIILKDKKVAGILVETTISNSKIEKIIGGIGVNVNQVDFSDHLPNASSLAKLFPEKIWERSQVLYAIIKKLEHCLSKEFQEDYQSIFNDNLYKINEPISVVHSNKQKQVINLGVDDRGYWHLRDQNNQEKLIIKSSQEIVYLYV